MTEYTGQLIGGPDDGNLITATTRRIVFHMVQVMWPDGPSGLATYLISRGEYIWDPEKGCFNWKKAA